jgi:ribonuclease R
MISIRDMKDDYYNFDEIHHQLKGQRGGKVFRLGDTITIQVASFAKLAKSASEGAVTD